MRPCRWHSQSRSLSRLLAGLTSVDLPSSTACYDTLAAMAQLAPAAAGGCHYATDATAGRPIHTRLTEAYLQVRKSLGPRGVCAGHLTGAVAQHYARSCCLHLLACQYTAEAAQLAMQHSWAVQFQVL
jgi:hypothetical protein